MKQINSYIYEKLHITKKLKSICNKESFIDAFTNAGCICTDRGDNEFTIWCKEENKFPYMMLNLFNDFWTSYYTKELHVITDESENDDVIYSFDVFKKCPGCTTNRFEYSQYNFDILLEMLKENETV